MDTDPIARAIAAAFQDDPLIAWFFPERSQRVARTFYTFRMVARYTQQVGLITPLTVADPTAGDTTAGAALWLDSDQLHPSLLTELRLGGFDMLRQQGMRAVWRQMQAHAQMLAIHERLLATSHQYLFVLGIAPAFQGRGLATGLVTAGIEQAEAKGVPCYLDTNNPNNVGLYQRFGFEVVHYGQLRGCSVEHWAMIRPA